MTSGSAERSSAQSTPLESGREFKLYAPGVGLITDGLLVLVSYTKR